MHRRIPVGDSSQSSLFFSPWRKRGAVLVVGLLLVGCLLIGGRSVEEEGLKENTESQLTESQVESTGESIAEQLAPVGKGEGQFQEPLEMGKEELVAAEAVQSSVLKGSEEEGSLQENQTKTVGELDSVRAPLLAGGQDQSSGESGGENSGSSSPLHDELTQD